MQSDATKPGRAGDPLLIVHIMLVGMLLVTLTLAAMPRRGGPATVPAAATTPTSTPFVLPTPTSNTQSAEAAMPTGLPTITPSPTIVPTATTEALGAPTPAPEPIIRRGTGNAIFPPRKWIGPAIVRILYDGKGSFQAWTQNEDGQREVMLANTIGAYRGDSLIDFTGSQSTYRLEVLTAESWQVEVLPLSRARVERVPGTITGSGDEVIWLEAGAKPDQLTANAMKAFGIFAVWAYGDPSSLVINAAAPYSGAVTLPGRTDALAVKATGPWSLEVTTK